MKKTTPLLTTFSIFILVFIVYTIKFAPHTEIFLTASGFNNNVNEFKKTIAKFYFPLASYGKCHIDGYFGTKRLKIPNVRLVFASTISEVAENNSEIKNINSNIIAKELNLASKQCHEREYFYFQGQIGNKYNIKYPAIVYTILSGKTKYFEALLNNCIPVDTEFSAPSGTKTTPARLIKQLKNNSGGELHKIYQDMDSLVKDNLESGKCSKFNEERLGSSLRLGSGLAR